jgi:hypothetical protein
MAASGNAVLCRNVDDKPVTSAADIASAKPMMLTMYESPQQQQPILPYPPHYGSYPYAPAAQIHHFIPQQPHVTYPFFQTPYYPSMMMQQASMYAVSPLNASPGIPMSLPSDAERLSAYQSFLRKQFEFFQAGPLDAQTTAQGRKRPVAIGQGELRKLLIHNSTQTQY